MKNQRNMDQPTDAQAKDELRYLLNELKAVLTKKDKPNDRHSIKRRLEILLDYTFVGYGLDLADVQKILAEAATLPIQE